MKWFSIILCGLAAVVCSGCSTVAAPTTMERRYVQTREFGVPYDIAYMATIAAFQDQGFSIKNVDRQIGLITARSATEAEAAGFWKAYVTAERSRGTYKECTAQIEQLREGVCEIRLSFTTQTEVSYLQGGNEVRGSIISDPAFYNSFFDHIDKAIYVRKNLRLGGGTH